MSEAKVKVKQENGCHVVTVEGEVDCTTVKMLEDIIPELKDADLLILDLSAVTYFGSEGIKCLMALRANTGVIILAVAVSQQVRNVLDITKLSPFFPIYDKQETAFRIARTLCKIKSGI